MHAQNGTMHRGSNTWPAPCDALTLAWCACAEGGTLPTGCGASHDLLVLSAFHPAFYVQATSGATLCPCMDIRYDDDVGWYTEKGKHSVCPTRMRLHKNPKRREDCFRRRKSRRRLADKQRTDEGNGTLWYLYLTLTFTVMGIPSWQEFQQWGDIILLYFHRDIYTRSSCFL